MHAQVDYVLNFKTEEISVIEKDVFSIIHSQEGHDLSDMTGAPTLPYVEKFFLLPENR